MAAWAAEAPGAVSSSSAVPVSRALRAKRINIRVRDGDGLSVVWKQSAGDPLRRAPMWFSALRLTPRLLT